MSTRDQAIAYLPRMIQKILRGKRYRSSKIDHILICLLRVDGGYYLTNRRDPSCYSSDKLDMIYLVVVDPTNKSYKIIDYDPLDYHNVLSSFKDDFDSYEIG